LFNIELRFIGVPAYILVTVFTVEQQQWTGRNDISNTVDSAGDFRVAAAATTDVLFHSGFWFLILQIPVRIWLQIFLTFVLLFCTHASSGSKNFLFSLYEAKLRSLPTIYCTGFLRFYFLQNFRVSKEKKGGF
jgi:hypothetical protein